MLSWEFQIRTMQGAIEIVPEEAKQEQEPKPALPEFNLPCNLCGKRFIVLNGYISCNCRKFKV